jgi:hypothetical protein
MIQDVLTQLSHLAETLTAIGDIDTARAAAQSQLDAVNHTIGLKRDEANAASQIGSDLTARPAKLRAEVQALDAVGRGVRETQHGDHRASCRAGAHGRVAREGGRVAANQRQHADAQRARSPQNIAVAGLNVFPDLLLRVRRAVVARVR